MNERALTSLLKSSLFSSFLVFSRLFLHVHACAPRDCDFGETESSGQVVHRDLCACERPIMGAQLTLTTSKIN